MMIALSLEEQKTKSSYNKFAREWHTDRSRINLWKNEFKKFRSLLPAGSIIDIGCGSGVNAPWFVKAGYEYIGVDYSRGLIDIAISENPEAEFIEMDMYDLFFPPNRFDGFWSAASLLHAPKEKVPKILRQIKNVVKRGGVGFISVMEGGGEGVDELPAYGERFFARYSLSEFAEILKKEDFEIIESYAALYKKLRNRGVNNWLIYFVRNIK